MPDPAAVRRIRPASSPPAFTTADSRFDGGTFAPERQFRIARTISWRASMSVTASASRHSAAAAGQGAAITRPFVPGSSASMPRRGRTAPRFSHRVSVMNGTKGWSSRRIWSSPCARTAAARGSRCPSRSRGFTSSRYQSQNSDQKKTRAASIACDGL
jgi:hypothetical protein